MRMDESAQPRPLEGSRLWLAAVGLALTNFVVLLDTTITNVSIPHIAGGLAVSVSQGTWTITSYAVAEAITVPLSGWLSIRFGSLRTLIWALLGFGLFSLLCGTARTIELLVVFRVFQGLCGGPIMPMTQTMMVRVFPPEKMPMANSLWGVTTIAAPILGPLAGGTIADNFDWPWIFYINLPVVGLSYAIMNGVLRRFETRTRRERVDAIGMVLLVLFAGSLQLVLDLGREHDWFGSNMIVSLAVVAVIAFAAFVVWELTELHPAVDLRVLRHRSLALGLPVMATSYGSIFAMLVLVPLWLQSVLGYTATSAGQVMAMQGVLAIVCAPVAAALIQRFDLRIVISVGMMIVISSTAMRLGWTTDAGFWSFAGAQLLQGLGMPLFFIGTLTISLRDVPQAEFAMSAGLLSFMRTISMAAAAALSTSAWDHATRSSRAEMVGTLHGVDEVAAVLPLGQNGAGLSLVERLVDAQAATIGASSVYGGAILASLGALALVWLMPRAIGSMQSSPAH